eukprot:GHVR01037930.1.p1 GENE.GHVR01037930.1~~GHVR01037930.1.p1  ORF type:complete len:400 (+),score=44.96 GHVR01037930.1:2-1201(+)
MSGWLLLKPVAWGFLQRLLPDTSHTFLQIEAQLTNEFIPALLGSRITKEERKLFSLPVNHAGLGIEDPTSTADRAYTSSINATQHLTNAIRRNEPFDIDTHIQHSREARTTAKTQTQATHEQLFNETFNNLGSEQRRCVMRTQKHKMSGWLLLKPVATKGNTLSEREFRDALHLRYGKALINLPPDCECCGSPLTNTHTLDCRKGGADCKRHNEVRDVIADLLSSTYNQVQKEVIISEASHPHKALVADIKARGVWHPQTDTMLDLSILNTDAPSHLKVDPDKVIVKHAKDKKKQYQQAYFNKRCTFTPLMFSVDGATDKDTAHFLCHIARRLNEKINCTYQVAIHWIRTRISLALIRATSGCIRNTKVKWRTRDITPTTHHPHTLHDNLHNTAQHKAP